MSEEKQIRKMILPYSPTFLEEYQKVAFDDKFKYCLYWERDNVIYISMNKPSIQKLKNFVTQNKWKVKENSWKEIKYF